MKRILYIAVAMLVAAVGCKNRGNEVVTPPTTFEVKATEITVNHEAQKIEIEVVCNEEFDVKEDVFWLTVANMLDGETENTKIVVLSTLANDSEEARSAEVVIVAGELQHTVTITQSGMVATSMEVAIGHRNKCMESPTWGGEVVTGSINWGDGVTEEYVEGITHDYADDESHTATFTMSGARSFVIEKIGDMESLTIAVD